MTVEAKAKVGLSLVEALARPEPPAAAEPLLTAKELADRLKMCRTDVYVEAKHGDLPCIRWNGKVRFRYSDVVAYLERLQIAAVGGESSAR